MVGIEGNLTIKEIVPFYSGWLFTWHSLPFSPIVLQPKFVPLML